MKQKSVCVLGGHGFIGHHLARRLYNEGWFVRTVDIAGYAYGEVDFCNDYIIGDLRNPNTVSDVLYLRNNEPFDLVVQLAASMGGMEFLASGKNDADVMHDSALINLNVAHYSVINKVKKLFYSSSACIYPMELQNDENNVGLKESDAIPAHPDLCYGWEKLHSEILYDAYRRNYGLDIAIGRFHNVYGIEGTWKGNRAKFPAAICRKVAEAKNGSEVEVLGTGAYTRSFIEVDECIEGVLRLIDSWYHQPVNIGSDYLISVNELALMVINLSGKDLKIKNVPSEAVGVVGRNSNNDLIKSVLAWSPSTNLRYGLLKLYNWINQQVNG